MSAKLIDRLKNATDFFSIRLLVENMFAPFRQISAGEASTSGPQISIFLDKLLSRVIGAIVRFLLLIVGMVTIILQAIGGVAVVIVWPFIPFAPVICVVLAIMQVTF